MKISINRVHRKRLRASLLIEVAAGFGALLIVSLLLLKAAVAVTTVQQWTVVQGLSDAYMSREVALAKRYPFEDFLSGAGTAQWPATAPISTTAGVVIGRLPGGNTVTGTLHRIRVADTDNLAASGGTGDADSNPTGVEMWKLQSYLTYTISGRDYVKSRTVLRSR